MSVDSDQLVNRDLEKLLVLGLLEKIEAKDEKPQKKPRKFEGREPTDTETLQALQKKRDRRSRLIAFSTKKKMPPCPHCGQMLFFESENTWEYRIVCFGGSHQAEVVKISGETFWVTKDFFKLE